MKKLSKSEIQDMNYIPEKPQYLIPDENGEEIFVFKCQRLGCNNFYSARKGSKRKQCGCGYIANGRKRGKLNRKTNSFYFPIEYNFGVCFYDNYDGYFIFDLEDYEFIKKHHCTALINNEKKRVDPICTVNGKQVLLARCLMKTPEGLEVDHINHNTNDLRKCNLRNCTKEQNNHNRRNAKQGEVKRNEKGKYVIIDFPKEDVSHLLFDTREAALDFLFALQDKYFGEYGSRRSGEISAKYATDYFSHGAVCCNGILKKIQALPERNVFKLELNNILRNFKAKRISECQLGEELFRLIHDYKEANLKAE